jgi:glutamine synthetase
MGYHRSVLEYVWIDALGNLRSKTKVLEAEVVFIKDVPLWNFDGSSTGQAEGSDSEVMLIPCTMYRDPFRGDPNKIILCETMRPDGSYLENSHRHWANDLFNKNLETEPWFGLEQEYFLMNRATKKPLGFDENLKQGQFYCSTGSENAFGRDIVEEHLNSCLFAGIKISGVNAEVAPGQWEFQVGPCTGIEEGDQLWVARYLLLRIAEKYNVMVDFTPKPLKGDWNGSGCHANYSTKLMRDGLIDDYGITIKKGIEYINEAIEKLSKKHKEHMDVYGKDNDQRMSGEHETASYDSFSVGIANRGRSVRIGNDTLKNEQGYFEDRRPGSNCDPYLVTGMLFKTTVIDE